MTEKLKMEQNPLSVTVEKIKEICPAAVTSEGKIDFEELKTALSDDVAADAIEKYEFTWVGKNTAKAEANRPIRKTLRPVVADSKNWDTTKNLYIEGDNLDALKLLQESYLGKVKMIYIDPPYNTGNDFVYCDEFAAGCEEYLDKKGQCDSDGNRLFKNTETNGRFHSDWCTMMYPRLKVARDLLTDDGVIFISMDYHELTNLKKICDEVFGEGNLLGVLSVINNLKGRSDSAFFATCNEFLLVYSKQKLIANINGFEVEDEEIDNDYKFEDEISKYKPIGFRKTGNGWKREDRPYMFYPVIFKNDNFNTVSPEEYKKIYNETSNTFDDAYVKSLKDKYEKLGYEFILPTDESGNYGRWRWGLETFFKEKDINLVFNSAHSLCTKMRATIEDGSVRVKTAKTLWYKPEYDTGTAGKILKKLFDKDIFDNPKSPIYMYDILKVGSNKDSLILDFFSGAATTAHAVMQLNAEDGGNRRFIMVQLPEECDTDSEAFKAGYKNICEIGKERIRRAGEKIKAEHPDKDLDIGFRVLRIDSTNMKDVYYKPSDMTQETLLDSIDNIKNDRTDLDLLFGVMVDCGLPLDMPIETKTCDGKKYYVVNGGDYLVACFESEISEKLVYEIANLKPTIAVFRDSSFADAKDKVNVTEIFKNITGRDDCVKVL